MNPITSCRKLLPGLLLAVPLSALADPLTVITRSSGIADVNPTVLYYLLLDNTIEATELPYELTIRSNFDPVGDLPGRGEPAWERNSQVDVEFTIGGMTYRYTGSGLTSAMVYTPFAIGDAYYHQVELEFLHFRQTGYAPAGMLGPGGALAMRDLGGITSGRIDIGGVPPNPDAPGSFSMGGTVDSFSVQVVSAVPEPASTAMLAAGLCVLGWRRARA